MVQFQPFLQKRTLGQDVLQADFGDGPVTASQNYFLGEQALYRKLVSYLPIWRYVPYDAIVAAQAIQREFRVGG